MSDFAACDVKVECAVHAVPTHTAQVRSAGMDAKRDYQAALQLVDFGKGRCRAGVGLPVNYAQIEKKSFHGLQAGVWSQMRLIRHPWLAQVMWCLTN